MKRALSLITTIIALALPVVASASLRTINTDHFNMGFKVRHLMASNKAIFRWVKLDADSGFIFHAGSHEPKQSENLIK